MNLPRTLTRAGGPWTTAPAQSREPRFGAATPTPELPVLFRDDDPEVDALEVVDVDELADRQDRVIDALWSRNEELSRQLALADAVHEEQRRVIADLETALRDMTAMHGISSLTGKPTRREIPPMPPAEDDLGEDTEVEGEP